MKPATLLTFGIALSSCAHTQPLPVTQLIPEKIKHDVATLLLHPYEREIINISQRKGWDSGPSLSYDGNVVAFVSSEAGKDAIRIVDRKEGVERIILDGEYSDPSLSADGKTITYQQSLLHSNGEIFKTTLETGITKNISHHPAQDWNPVATSDGRYVSFISDRVEPFRIWGLYVADTKENTITEIERGIETYQHAMSRDGNVLAYVKYEDKKDLRTRIVVYDRKSAQRTVIPSDVGYDTEPSLSPNGAVLHYTKFVPDKTREEERASYPASGSSVAYGYGLRTGNQWKNQSSNAESFHSFAPDGEMTAFTRYEDVPGSKLRRGTVKLKVDVVEEKPLGNPGWDCYGTTFSGDGKWVAYTCRIEGDNEVFIQNVEKLYKKGCGK